MTKILMLMMAGFLVAACGGSSESLCQQIGAATCQKACACREGPTCAIDEGGGVVFDFNTEADCRTIFVSFACSSGDKAAYNDAAACLPLVQAAMCTGTGVDAALSYPADMACQSPPSP